MKKKEERILNGQITLLTGASQNQSSLLRIKKNSTNLAPNETIDSGDNNKIPKEYETDGEHKRINTKILQDKEIIKKIITNNSSFEQIFDPSMPYQYAHRCYYWDECDRIQKGKLFITDIDVVFKRAGMPFVRAHFDLKEIEKVFIIKKFKDSSESVLCIQLKNEFCYNFLRFNHPKTNIQKKLLHLSAQCPNQSHNISNREENKDKISKVKISKQTLIDKNLKSEEQKLKANTASKDEKINNFIRDSKKSFNKLKSKIIPSSIESKPQSSKIEEETEKSSKQQMQPIYIEKSMVRKKKCFSENEIDHYLINRDLNNPRPYLSEITLNQSSRSNVENEMIDSVWNLNRSHSVIQNENEKSKSANIQEFYQNRTHSHKKHHRNKFKRKSSTIRTSETQNPVKKQLLSFEKLIIISMVLFVIFLVFSMYFYNKLDTLEHQLMSQYSSYIHSV